MQYTIRQIPDALDRALREIARRTGRSLNEEAIQALIRGVGLGEETVRRRELKDLAGTWLEDPEFDRALKDQHRVDRSLWK